MKKQKNEVTVPYRCGCTLTLIPRFKGVLRIDRAQCKHWHGLNPRNSKSGIQNNEPLVLTDESRKSLQILADAIFHVLSLREAQINFGSRSSPRRKNVITESQEFKDLKAAMEKGIKKPN